MSTLAIKRRKISHGKDLQPVSHLSKSEENEKIKCDEDCEVESPESQENQRSSRASGLGRRRK